MELTEAIRARRSIRKFTDADLSDEMVKELLSVAVLAPSAKNRQPWRFMIVRGETKSAISELMRKWQTQNSDVKTSIFGTAQAIDEAPVLVLVFKEYDSGFERSDTLSIGGMIQTMLLKATEMGLGSLWICDTSYVRSEISELVGTKLDLYSAISLGYADEHPNPRPRKSLEDVMIK